MELQTFARCWIMVIADDAAIRARLMDVLNAEKYSTIGVADGEAAEEWLKSADPDPTLIVLEGAQNMVDGIRLRNLQQPDPREPLIHVIVLAPEQEVSTLERSGIAQELTVLPKSTNLERVVALAAQHCHQDNN